MEDVLTELVFAQGRDLGDETVSNKEHPDEPLPLKQASITSHASYAQSSGDLIDRAAAIELAKRPDYTLNSADVLKNFKASAEEAGVTPEQAWIIFAKKHWDAIRSIMRNPGRNYSEPPRERFADLLNYLKLGYALYLERERKLDK